METKKYELVKDDTIIIDGKTLYRIKALKDFSDVKAGDLGGYISGEHNLSHEGNCWIYDDACAYDRTNIRNDAQVYGNAKVYGWANIYNKAIVYDNARVYDSAKVCVNARVYGDAKIYSDAEVFGNARVFGNAKVYDRARVYDDAEVLGDAEVYDDAIVYGDAEVYDDAKVCVNARVYGTAKISGNANISSNKDYLYIKGLGSANRSTTAFKQSDDSIYVNCGCFNGTLDEFESKVKETHGDNKCGREYMLFIHLMKIHFDLV